MKQEFSESMVQTKEGSFSRIWQAPKSLVHNDAELSGFAFQVYILKAALTY